MTRPEDVLPSGLPCLDHMLDGGLRRAKIVQVYGIAAAGKTTLSFMFIKRAYEAGYSSVLINSEPSSPFARLEQIMNRPFTEVEDRIHIFAPKSFEEQAELIDNLDIYMRQDVALVVVDTLTGLYRASLEDKEQNYRAHRELNRQMGILKGLAQYRNLWLLVLNQVRANLDAAEREFEPVAKNIMDYWTDTVLRMEVGRLTGERIVIREDSGTGPQRCPLILTESGFVPLKSTHEKE